MSSDVMEQQQRGSGSARSSGSRSKQNVG
jgi:hypothetical protein